MSLAPRLPHTEINNSRQKVLNAVEKVMVMYYFHYNPNNDKIIKTFDKHFHFNMITDLGAYIYNVLFLDGGMMDKPVYENDKRKTAADIQVWKDTANNQLLGSWLFQFFLNISRDARNLYSHQVFDGREKGFTVKAFKHRLMVPEFIRKNPLLFENLQNILNENPVFKEYFLIRYYYVDIKPNSKNPDEVIKSCLEIEFRTKRHYEFELYSEKNLEEAYKELVSAVKADMKIKSNEKILPVKRSHSLIANLYHNEESQHKNMEEEDFEDIKKMDVKTLMRTKEALIKRTQKIDNRLIEAKYVEKKKAATRTINKAKKAQQEIADANQVIHNINLNINKQEVNENEENEDTEGAENP